MFKGSQSVRIVAGSSESSKLARESGNRSVAAEGAVTTTKPEIGDLTWVDDLSFAEAKRKLTARFERVYLSRLMRSTEGNISEAARIAGVDRSNLRRSLLRCGLLEEAKARRLGSSD